MGDGASHATRADGNYVQPSRRKGLQWLLRTKPHPSKLPAALILASARFRRKPLYIETGLLIARPARQQCSLSSWSAGAGCFKGKHGRGDEGQRKDAAMPNEPWPESYQQRARGEKDTSFSRRSSARIGAKHYPFQGTILCRACPSPAMPSSTVSPGFRYCGGLIPRPTPAGVPVLITSPGKRVMNWLM